MSLGNAVLHFDSVLSKPRQSLKNFLDHNPVGTFSLFSSLHLPLGALFPISALASPYLHTFSSSSWSWSYVFMPFFILCLFLFFAAIYDRIVEYASPNLKLPPPSQKRNSNIAFYFHLPVAGVGPFFFFHPYLGYAMLFLAELWSTLYSLEYMAAAHKISRARSLSYWIMSFIFLLLGFAALLFLFTLFRSIEELMELP